MMDFPSFQLKPVEAFFGADMVCILENEEQVRSVHPNQKLIWQMDGVCFHIAEQGSEYDCVTRSFAPKCNVAEDPVCGRGHCHIIPYWAGRIGKTEFTAYQASARSGVLYCSYAGERTVLRGKAAFFAEAEIFI